MDYPPTVLVTDTPDTGPPVQQARGQGTRSAAGSGVGHNAGGLVDHCEVVILEDDIKLDGLRLQRHMNLLERPDELVACADAASRFDHLPRKLYGARFQCLTDGRSAVTAEMGKDLVGSLPFRLHRYLPTHRHGLIA
jgi:hypothetical protein